MAALLAVPVAAPPARADDPPAKAAPKDASDDDAKAALERFSRDFANESLDARIDAVKRLGRVVHPTVADRLLEIAFQAKDGLARAEAFQGLGRQASSRARLAPPVAKWLADEADATVRMNKRGDYGVLVDPKTGEPDLESPAGKERLRRKRDRGAVLAAALGCLGAMEGRATADALAVLLQDGNDDLVVESLAQIGKLKEWKVLPGLLTLFEMYPEEQAFETGNVSVDTGASGNEDQAAARRRYMAKYGDPDKRRARPAVFRALKQCLKEITGQEFAAPKDLRAFLKRPEVEKKVKPR